MIDFSEVVPRGAGAPWFSGVRDLIFAAERSGTRHRTDDDFPWDWYRGLSSSPAGGWWRGAISRVRSQVRRLCPWRTTGYQWIREHRDELEGVRRLFEDDASRAAFDAHLALSAAGPLRLRYRPVVHSPIEIIHRRPFAHPSLSADYMGLPLEWFGLRLSGCSETIQVLTTELQVRLLDRFGQYFPEGAGRVCRPREGDIVLDCGACVGDISILFAAVVGPGGKVFAFDPLSVHHEYLRIQREANPKLESRIIGVVSAVGDRNHEPSECDAPMDSSRVNAAFRPAANMRFVRIDDFVAGQALDRVDLIKMDVEGAEPAVLRGAASVIRRYRPRLAVSAYHDRQHLLELPRIIREIEPAYRFAFAQHCPDWWEAVLYAWCEPKDENPAGVSV